MKRKIRKKSKKLWIVLLLLVARNYKACYVKTNRSFYLTAILECTICIVDPMYSKVLTSCIDYKQDSIKCKCVSLGVTEHTKQCHRQFNGIHPKTITIIPNMYKTKVGEVLDINRLKTLNETDETLKVQNRDNDHYFITKNWKLLFQEIGNLFFSFAFLIYKYNILFIFGESNDIDPTFLLFSILGYNK